MIRRYKVSLSLVKTRLLQGKNQLIIDSIIDGDSLIIVTEPYYRAPSYGHLISKDYRGMLISGSGTIINKSRRREKSDRWGQLKNWLVTQTGVEEVLKKMDEIDKLMKG
ncbi:hypothetical protein [Paenibacillus agricola]|uniref:Uncharacterized protein n=1 Tax=Paenibacillus agricola TaxID=2716264 RepID=A0ABX0JEJ8_9BACL|nr:hypothetical protein [Paenibacillus agricola]NHN34970.1 hypothetical protein [Paenibacillus agricola]